MFLLLHRLMRLGVVALWLGLAFLLWEQRERGRPLVDLYEAWRDSGYQQPPALPRMEGRVARVLGENTIQFRTAEGETFNLTIAGATGGIAGPAQDISRRQFAAETCSNLTARFRGQPVSFAHTLLQPNHAGVGFAYVGTNQQNVTVELVAEGRGKLVKQALRVLPLREQAALRAADRAAQAGRKGLWAQGSDTTAGQ